ncbi:MAG: hypothetical protein ABEK50_17940 [bacterium]
MSLDKKKILNGLTLVGIGICVLTLLYAHTKSFFSYDVSLYKYYISTGVFSAFLLYLLFSGTEAQEKSLSVLGSILFTIYLVELILFCIPSWFFNPLHRQAWLQGVKVDSRSKLQVVNDLNSKDIKAVPSVTPLHILNSKGPDFSPSGIFPLSGVPDRFTVFCNEQGPWVNYHSDRHGFNNPDNVWDTRTTDVFMMGDSFTQGVCVNRESTMAGVLRRAGLTVVNGGMAGSGPLIEKAILNEYAVPKKPRFVVWNYVEANDLFDLKNELNSDYLTKYKDSQFKQNLYKKPEAVRRTLKETLRKKRKFLRATEGYTIFDILRLRHTSKFIDLVKPRVRRSLGIAETRSPDSVADPEQLRKILSQVNDKVKTWDGQLLFVYLPIWERYRRGMTETAMQEHFKRKEILNMVRDLGVPVLDLHADFFKHQENPKRFFPYRTGGHYNELGYCHASRLIAEKIASIDQQTEKLSVRCQE